jgi:hypothetical protein
VFFYQYLRRSELMPILHPLLAIGILALLRLTLGVKGEFSHDTSLYQAQTGIPVLIH